MIRLKRKRLYFSLLPALMASAITFAVNAQVLYPDQPKNRNLILANELFNQGHYGLAEQCARGYLESNEDKAGKPENTFIEQARYIIAVSAIKSNEVGLK